MSAALSVFKLSVQSVRQLLQHKIEVFFESTGLSLSYQWTPLANHSILKPGSSQLGNVSWFWRIASQYCTSHDNPTDRDLAT